MFFDYLKELEGTDAIANESGFITYRIAGDECYVSHLYISPQSRNNKRAKALFNSLKRECKEKDVAIMSCNVFKKDSGNERNIAIYEAHGFKILSENDNAFTMVKEL